MSKPEKKFYSLGISEIGGDKCRIVLFDGRYWYKTILGNFDAFSLGQVFSKYDEDANVTKGIIEAVTYLMERQPSDWKPEDWKPED